MGNVSKKDLLYPGLSFQILGVLFEVSNTLGFGFREIYYQKAVAKLLQKNNLKFKEQVKVNLLVGGEIIGYGIADFIIEEKVILELKRGDKFRKDNFDQLYSYSTMTGMQLGILANFTSRGLLFKRVINTLSAPNNFPIRNSPIRNS